MSTLLLYDNDLDKVADQAGDFDAGDFYDNERWIRKQWVRYSNVLGFRGELDRILNRKSRNKGLINVAALRAFKNWHLQQSAPHRDPELARVRHEALRTILRVSPSNLWSPELESEGLPDTACYTPHDVAAEGRPAATANSQLARMLGMRVTSAEVQPRKRVFRSDVTASFFHDRDPRRAPEGCSYLVKLSLGTFPYVYGRQLAEPPGMLWAPSGEWFPAVLGMRIASDMWSQTGNLRQDARVVARQFHRFKLYTSRVLDTHTRDARNPQTGLLTRPIARVVDPLGSLTASGYTLVYKAFAAFFAARRAYLRSPRTFTPATYKAIQANPDPLLRDALGVSESP